MGVVAEVHQALREPLIQEELQSRLVRVVQVVGGDILVVEVLMLSEVLLAVVVVVVVEAVVLV